MDKLEKKQKHIMIITYHMVNHTKQWGGAQRMYFLAQQLVDNGYKVTVVHASYGRSSFLKKNVLFESVPVMIRPAIFQRYQEKSQDDDVFISNSSGGKHKVKYYIKNIFRPLYRFIERYFYNDFGGTGFYVHLWSMQAWPVIKGIIKKNGTKQVIISGPYFSSFRLSGLIHSNFPKTKLILDYRDPWNHLIKGSSFITRRKEKRYLEVADHITVFSEQFRADLMHSYHIDSGKVHSIYNGYDKCEWIKAAKELDYIKQINKNITNDRKMVISYIASSIVLNDTYRDITKFVISLSLSKFKDNIILNLVGVRSVKEFHEFNFLGLNVNLIERVAHEKTLKILLKSDIVIILSTEKKPSLYTLTGKLFDCIRSGAFILGISNNKDIAYGKIINELGVGMTVANTVDELQLVINKLFLAWQSGKLMPHKIDANIMNTYSRSYQNKQLINLIK